MKAKRSAIQSADPLAAAPAATPRASSRHAPCARVELELDPMQELHALATLYFTENVAMNAAKSKSEKARADLEELMRKRGISEFTVPASGLLKPLNAVLETPDREVVDCKALSGEVTMDVFMACITSTKKAVEEHAGKHVLAKVLTLVPGTEHVKVKMQKD